MHVHYVQTESDQRDQSIYGIRRTCRTYLTTKFDLSTQACMHTHYVLACLGKYLNRIGLDQNDEGIYGIGRTYWTHLST